MNLRQKNVVDIVFQNLLVTYVVVLHMVMMKGKWKWHRELGIMRKLVRMRMDGGDEVDLEAQKLDNDNVGLDGNGKNE